MLKFFSFHGRAKRSEYWGVAAFLFIASIFLQVLGFGLLFLGPLVLVLIPIVIIMLWLNLAVTARRLRDAGINHCYMLLLLVPLANLVAGIAWGCIKSKR